MYSYRVEDLGDHTGYVISRDGRDVMTLNTREAAVGVLDCLREGVIEANIPPIAASALATAYHGDQDHGCLKIIDHLEAVASMVSEHCGYARGTKYYNDIVSAAWCHDILEDTHITLEKLSDVIGLDAAGIVLAVTDSPGKNRYARHLNTYWRIREFGTDAILVKLADRWHNHFRSIEHNEVYLDMYRKEYPYFKIALWRPDEHVTMWERLDNQYEKMNGQKL